MHDKRYAVPTDADIALQHRHARLSAGQVERGHRVLRSYLRGRDQGSGYMGGWGVDTWRDGEGGGPGKWIHWCMGWWGEGRGEWLNTQGERVELMWERGG